MVLGNIWSRLFGRRTRRRVSFYESQDIMRRAIEAAGMNGASDPGRDVSSRRSEAASANGCPANGPGGLPAR
jgi:hypothetical protein